MKFKTGDKVRVKSWEEIVKTLDSERECHGVYFNDEMEEFCGSTLTIGPWNDGDVYEDNKSGWVWSEQWLEPIGNFDKKEKEPVKTEKVVVVRGMNEQQVRKYLGALPESIETVEMPRSVEVICRDIFAKHRDKVTSYFFKDNVTVAVTRDGHVGVAHLRAGDIFSLDVGRALARARALRFKALEKELLAAL